MSDSLQKGNNNFPDGQGTYQFIPNYGPKQNGDDGLDPRRIITILLRHKWLVLFFIIAGAAGAWIYAEVATPTYQSKGALMISSTTALPNDELSGIISKTTGYGTSSTLENELQILQSRKFSRQVARKLLDEDLGNMNRFPIMWSEKESGEIYRASEEEVAERIRSELVFKQPEEDSDVIEISFTSSSPEEAAKIINTSMEIYVEGSTQQNREAASSTAELLKKEKEEITQKLEESEEKLRSFMDATGIVQVDEQANSMVTRRAEIESELQRIKIELETNKQTIANYEQQLDRIKPGLSDQFSEAVGPRIRNAQEELARYENERSQIIAKNPDVLQRESVPPRFKFINDQIERIKGEIKELSSQLFTENDEFLGLDGEDRAQRVSEIQSRLVELRIEQNQYQSRRDALEEQKAEMDSNFNSLPEGMVELAKLQRDVRINEELYLNVTRQHADMSIWTQSQFGFGRIIDPGEVPEVPVSPNKMLLMILGVMLGGLFSAGFIAVKETMDNSVKSVEQLRTMNFPSLPLSVIPSIEKVSKRDQKTFTKDGSKIPEEMVLLYDRSNIVSESIRRLKNNIIYKHGDTPPKTIAVTSPEKGDGKSTIVANLGIAFAEEGYKTLVIGTDFRRPKLQKYFGITETSGLSDYLNGDLTFQEILMLIQNTEFKSLKVLIAGKETQRPEVIGSSRSFKVFLEKMEEVFDVIILDTPPFGILSDSAALLKDAEATLVVAKYRKTNKGMFIRTIEELNHIQANIAGIVLNDFDHRKEAGDYYGAGYYQVMYDNYKAY